MAGILEYLHNFSPPLIHRDIKPSNIIFVPPDKIYLIDFGAVRDKLLNLEQGGSTIIGTFGYMPMEQYEGRAVPGTDIYSLGITLIHLLSHKDPAEMEKKHMRIDFRPHLTISKEFAVVIDKMIEPDYKDRFQSAKQLHKTLHNYSMGKTAKALIQKDKPAKKKMSLIFGFIIGLIIMGSWIIPVTLEIIEEAKYKKELLKERIEKEYQTALDYIDNSEYKKAINLLEELGDYKDAEAQKAKAIELLDIEEKIAATAAEKAERYDTALKYKKEGKYTGALSLFRSLEDYRDSEKQIKEIEELIIYNKYKQAVGLLNDGEYEKALAILIPIKDYLDSGEKIEQATMYLETEKRFIKRLAFWGAQELAVSPDGKLIIYAKIYLNFLSLETGKKLKTINGHNGNYIRKIELNPDGSILATAGGKDKSFKFWNTRTFEEMKKISIDSSAMSVGFHPDGRTVACGHGDGTISLWTYPDWERIMSLKAQKGYISVLRFSKDGRILASGNEDYTIHLWDFKDGNLLMVFEGHTSWINDIRFLPDREHLVSGSSDHSIRLWSMNTGHEIKKMECDFLINAIDLDDTGNVLVCCGNWTCFEFWSIKTGQKIQRLDNFGHDVYIVMYTPDKKRVVSCGYDINLWSAEFD